jgi:hypothetical protein
MHPVGWGKNCFEELDGRLKYPSQNPGDISSGFLFTYLFLIIQFMPPASIGTFCNAKHKLWVVRYNLACYCSRLGRLKEVMG